MKRGLSVLLIAVSIILAACSQQQAGQSTAFTPTQLGTQGIVMQFSQNAPPTQAVYCDAPDALQFIVETRNKGAYNIDFNAPPQSLHKAFLHISGYDPNILQVTRPFSTNNNIDYFAGSAPDSMAAIKNLEGRSQYNPDGGVEYPQWQTNTIFLRGAEKYNPTIQVTACYQYQTTATPVVCVDPNPRNVVPQKKSCQVQDVSVGGGQGAPVAVTKVEEQVSKSTLQFKVWVSNQGGGDVLTPSPDSNSLVMCPDRLRFEDFNRVRAIVDLGGVAATCTPDIIRLNNNVGFTICKVPLDTSITSAFSTTLNVRLFYNYRSSIQKQVTVLATPGVSC
jgi:hypothetical protein